MSKQFEDTPQMLSYISWNLKRIAEEFERYNDIEDERWKREDERWRKENPPQKTSIAEALRRKENPAQSTHTKSSKLIDLLNNLDNGDKNGKI